MVGASVVATSVGAGEVAAGAAVVVGAEAAVVASVVIVVVGVVVAFGVVGLVGVADVLAVVAGGPTAPPAEGSLRRGRHRAPERTIRRHRAPFQRWRDLARAVLCA